MMERCSTAQTQLDFRARIIDKNTDAGINPDFTRFFRAYIGMETQAPLIGIDRPQDHDALARLAIEPDRADHRMVKGRAPVQRPARQRTPRRTETARKIIIPCGERRAPAH
jgi:hypothetical protein